jgi:serine protease AprX
VRIGSHPGVQETAVFTFGWQVAARRVRTIGQSTAALLAIAVVFTAASARPVQAQNEGKLDVQLQSKMRGAAADDAPVNVIVTVRPGARKGLLTRLEALGATVSSDFQVISASTVQLPPNRLRRLAQDKDVLSISLDAPVTGAGIAGPVSGTALNQAFSLRSTLGLRAAGAVSDTITFQQGYSGYTGSVSGSVNSVYQNTGIGYASRVKIEDEGGSGAQAGMLLKFDGLFGAGSGQIPVGSTITSATLRLSHLGDGSSYATAGIYRMLTGWDHGSTWASMTTSGPGIQRDNVEAFAAPDATVVGLRTSGAKVLSGAALTATIQAWANGSPNHGWVIWQNDVDAWSISSSQHSTYESRPVLSITYRAPVATTSLTGAGVTVAVLDSGILQDGSPARIKTARDFTNGSLNPPPAASADDYGHGTHVSGLVGGNKPEAEGVAPGVSFVDLRVLSSDGSGSTSHVIHAIEWAIAAKATYGIDVINLSLGHPIYEPAATDPLVQAVEAAVRAGIVVVTSAGNIGMNKLTGVVGYAGVTSPGNSPSAITVGATRTFETNTPADDVVADYSSRGPTWYDAFVKPDVVAPGHRLLSSAVASQHLYSILPTLRGPSYDGRASLRLSGTSMSAAVVSGSVALMIEAAREAFQRTPTPNTLKAMLQHSAFALTVPNSQAPYDVLTQGVGALNVLGAIDLARALNPASPPNSYWVAGAIPLASTIDGQTIGWSQNIVWGDNLIWGNALYTRLKAWSDNIVWGDSGDNIVWGDSDNIVWGDSLRDDNIVWGDTASDDNIVWGDTDDDNIVWGDDVEWLDNIVWGDAAVWGSNEDNIVWGDTDENIVWGDNENIVWGDTAQEPVAAPAAVSSPSSAPGPSGVDTDALDTPDTF